MHVQQAGTGAGAEEEPTAGAVIDRRCTECKDHVDAFKWCCADVSRDGEYICAGAVAPDKHIIYVWQAAGGHVASVLEGPDGGLQWCGWQPDPGRCAPVAISGQCMDMHAMHARTYAVVSAYNGLPGWHVDLMLPVEHNLTQRSI